jgi:hypothetical protein
MPLSAQATTAIRAIIIFGVIFLLAGLVFPAGYYSGWAMGYLLGLLAVILHYVMSLVTSRIDEQLFIKYFFTGLVIRFLIVLGLFFLLIISEKFDQLSFTVSFFISYIFHSVIDTILLNKKITDQTG